MNSKEILAPAGDLESVKAAFAAGADAIYFGLSDFNARKRAVNIELQQLPLMVAEAWKRGVKLFLTINTIITTEELPRLLELIDQVMLAGVTVFIVQDYGMVQLLGNYYPEAEIHLSTQATTHLAGQIAFLAQHRVARVNLSRELTGEEIKTYTEFAHSLGIETEVFVHGSYCISFSGQCYMSSLLEGLSGNRGYCAQLCRRPYLLGKQKQYRLNLKDNSAAPYAAELIAANVDSLKIEGRIKGPEYVYTTVTTWKELTAQNGSLESKESASAETQLASVFHRGFTAGYLENAVTSGMFSANPRDNSYQTVAEVSSYQASRGILEVTTDLGDPFPDTLMIKRASGEFVCSGSISNRLGPLRYAFTIEGKMYGKLHKGDLCFAREQVLFTQELGQRIAETVFSKIPVRVKVFCKAGEPLLLSLSGTRPPACNAEGGNTEGGSTRVDGVPRAAEAAYTVSAASEEVLTPAKKRVSTQEEVRLQLQRFGTTALEPESIEFAAWEDGLFIPASLINTVRREVCARFLGTLSKGRAVEVMGHLAGALPVRESGAGNRLTVLVDDPGLAVYFQEHGADIWYEAGDPGDPVLFAYTPYFSAVMDSGYAEAVRGHVAKGSYRAVVAQNTALVQYASEAGLPWIAGSALHIANPAAYQFFAEIPGFSGFQCSKELGRDQIEQLVDRTAGQVYLPLFERSLLMTTRQCLRNYQCGKKQSGKECFFCSCGGTSMKDVNGKQIEIVKRAFHYTELFEQQYYFAYPMVKDFYGKGVSFVVDLRLFPGSAVVGAGAAAQTGSQQFAQRMAEKKRLFHAFERFIEAPHKLSREIEALEQQTSLANYLRGLR